MPLAQCIRSGDLRSFDKALQKGEEEFIKRRIYLTLERGRDIALRNLLRKVFLAGGFEETKDENTAPVRRTRIALAEFQAAISMGSGGEAVDPDEVECLLANMIYKVSQSSLSFITTQPALRVCTSYPVQPKLPHAARVVTECGLVITSFVWFTNGACV